MYMSYNTRINWPEFQWILNDLWQSFQIISLPAFKNNAFEDLHVETKNTPMFFALKPYKSVTVTDAPPKSFMLLPI
jgi:hypothetical protein